MNYYDWPDKKQLSFTFDQIKYSTDRYCRDNPLKGLLVAAAEFAQSVGGPVALHNRKKK